MSEYDVLINKYDALNAGYDQLYPKPMKHADTHASGGTDPITPSDIGAYSKNETDTLLANKADSNNGKYLTALNLAYAGSPDVVRGKIFCSYDGSGNGIIGIDAFNSTDGSVARLTLRANGEFQKLLSTNGSNFGTAVDVAFNSQPTSCNPAFVDSITSSVAAYKDGCGMVSLSGNITVSSALSANQQMATVPEGFKPKANTFGCIVSRNSGNAYAIYLGKNGTLYSWSAVSETGEFVLILAPYWGV